MKFQDVTWASAVGGPQTCYTFDLELIFVLCLFGNLLLLLNIS